MTLTGEVISMRFFFAFSRFANHPPGPGPTSGRLLSAAKVEQIANAKDYKHQKRDEDGQEPPSKAASFIGTLVQFPDTGEPKKIMRQVPTPKDFLVAKMALLDLPSDPLAHQRKGAEQNNPNEECDLIQWHTDFSIVLDRESALGLAFDEIAA